MLTLLTTTGERPLAWALCERWMLAQTFQGPVRWVVVDDGTIRQPITFHRKDWELVLVRPELLWQPGMNTQATNILEGLAHIPADARLVIIEDDDYYGPLWLETVNAYLDTAELVGECRARYYNVSTRTFRQLQNAEHASLCSTAMRGPAIKAFEAVCSPGVKFIDLNLWRGYARKNKVLFTGSKVVGIKGLPGRAGIGMGHAAQFEGQRDSSGATLREWIGKDSEVYL